MRSIYPATAGSVPVSQANDMERRSKCEVSSFIPIVCLFSGQSFGFGEPPKVPFNADAALLAEHQVEPTVEGIVTYLRRLEPDPAVEAAAIELIRQLADEDFRVRENATRTLIELPSVPLKQLVEKGQYLDTREPDE